MPSPEGGGLYSVTLSLPDIRLAALPPVSPPYIYWARPETELYRLGLGCALRLETGGKERFDKLDNRLKQLTDNWIHYDPEKCGFSPGIFSAFAFAPGDPMEGPWQGLPNTLLVIPSLLLQSKEHHCTLTLTCHRNRLAHYETVVQEWLGLLMPLIKALNRETDSSDDSITLFRDHTNPGNSDWLGLVDRAKGAIRAGEFAKVVPARHIQLHGSHPFQPHQVMNRLAQRFPSCLQLAVDLGGPALVAATPERLVTLEGEQISCDALGGTGDRSDDPQLDRILTRQLMQSNKTRQEHALVVDYLKQALTPVCSALSVPTQPSVLKLRNLQHLLTRLEGTAVEGISLLELARRIHPTPAVAGEPVAPSLEWLAQHEPIARGWYSGNVGWLEHCGDGELAVLLRCALLQGNRADLYAGAGIVADSDPRAELDETELKLAAMLCALAGENVEQRDPLIPCAVN